MDKRHHNRINVGIEAEFSTPSGHKLDVPCILKWMHIYYDNATGLTNSMGMEIDAPSEDYLDFVSSVE